MQLTICDPACGSGAFLNQALDFLIKEHTYVDELKTKILGGGLQFPDIENTILENNIYGVDLNDESVEIAKLSLWLRTAQPRRKLNDLSSNIKCGNSLIGDKKVAGDKAFKWETSFPKVFEKGGFDVIIGNPPYGADLSSLEKEYIKKNYKTMEGDFDTYIYFMELSFRIGNKNSEIGMIVPNNLLLQKFGRRLRKMILDNSRINSIIDYGYKVFADAVVPTVVITYTVNHSTKGLQNIVKYIYRPEINELATEFESCFQNDFIENVQYAFNIQLTGADKKLLSKLSLNSKRLKQVCELKIGIEGDQKYINDFPISDISKPMVRGRNFHKYTIDFESDPKYIEYDPRILHRAREERLFNCSKKILIRQTGDRIIATLDTERLYAWKSVFVIVPIENGLELEYLLGILNSKTLNFQYQKMVGESGRAFAQVKGINLNPLPIKIPSDNVNSNIKTSVNNAIVYGEQFSKFNKKFKSYLIKKLHISLNRKLEHWFELEFDIFIDELNKAIKASNLLKVKEGLNLQLTLTKKDEFEWMELFEDNKKKAQELQTQIAQKEREIDQMVYELYGLSEDEIRIVENI